MFGLSEQNYNAVKRQAKACTAEIKSECAKEKYDRVAPALIDKHWHPVSTLVNRTQFIWIAGYLSGRYGNHDSEYE